MKSKYVILTSALLISVATFAQKDEIKAAEKALRKGEAQEAATILKGAESLISNASDAEKAQYFFVKGNAYLDLANKNIDTDKNLSEASAAYLSLIAAEKAAGKAKYATEAATSITSIKYKLINSAIEVTRNIDQSLVDCTFSINKQIESYKLALNAENQKLIEKLKSDLFGCEKSRNAKYVNSAQKLYDAYLLDKKDTLNLYYAASTYVNAKEYDNALKLYDDLKTLNYSGKGTSYLAVSKLTNEEDLFTTAQERDKMVKMMTHEKPRTEVIPSKRGEIYKNIALILVEKGRTDEAKKAIADARVANPDDTSLILTEANLYLETKDFDMYKKLITQALEKNPTDADLVFNLGVVNYNAKNFPEAEKYYKRAIEIKPDYVNAYLNLAIMKLDGDKVIFEEMNKLGNTEKDNKRYLVLKKQREVVFTGALPYLEKANELDPKNAEVKNTLISVYGALEMSEKKKALKDKM